jgi:hypothetical protein
MIDKIAELRFLPTLSRQLVTILYKVDRYNMGSKFVRLRIQKIEWLVAIPIDALRAVFEVESHFP